MYRNEKKLFAERTGSLVQSLQEPDTFKKLFLPLVVGAKEAAHKDLLQDSQEYQKAQERTWESYDRLEEQVKKVNDPGICRAFDEYLEADEISDTIWAEEMYLRGIQDAVAFLMLTAKKDTFDITGISLTQEGGKG